MVRNISSSATVRLLPMMFSRQTVNGDSLVKFPDSLVKQTSEDPPESIGVSFAADILKRDRQPILLLRKTV